MTQPPIHPRVAVRQLGPIAVLIAAPGPVRVVRRVINWWRQGQIGAFCHHTDESLVLYAPDDFTPITLPDEPLEGWPVVQLDSGAI